MRYRWLRSTLAVWLLFVLVPAGFIFLSYPAQGEEATRPPYRDYRSQVGKALQFFVYRVYYRREETGAYDQGRSQQPMPSASQRDSRRAGKRLPVPQRGYQGEYSYPANKPGYNPYKNQPIGFKSPAPAFPPPSRVRQEEMYPSPDPFQEDRKNEGDWTDLPPREEGPQAGEERVRRVRRVRHGNQKDLYRNEILRNPRWKAGRLAPREYHEEGSPRDKERYESRHEPRHESRHEPRHESRHEPRHESRHESNQQNDRKKNTKPTKPQAHEPKASKPPPSKRNSKGQEVPSKDFKLKHGKRFLGGLREKDFDLIAHAVYAESRGEPYVGQVAVAAVILNRMQAAGFPSTARGVIFQPRAFEAVADGQIWLDPDEKAYQAVEDALLGWDPAEQALYYYNPGQATSQWIRTRPAIKRIGRHVFCR